MEYRQLGKSDLKVPVVSFGAWAIGGWMWGGSDDAVAIRAIQCAVDLGITCIDTAPSYGFGRSETVVGKAIAGRRDKVLITTKCGVRWDLEEGIFECDHRMEDGTPVKLYWNLRPHSVRHELEQSLKRLGVDYVDLYQCHWPDTSIPAEDVMETLVELQREGKIRAIGVSNYSPELMMEYMEYGQLCSDQPLYNPLERDIEEDVLPFCIKNNIGVLAYSPIAQGLMSGKVTMDREFPPGDHRADRPWFKPANRKRVLDMLERLKPIAEGHGATLTQVAINWVISQEGITSALVGARNDEQVAENAKAADFKLSGEELQIIRSAVEGLGDPE